MKNNLIIFLCFFSSFAALSQDILELKNKLLSNEISDTAKVFIHLNIANLYFESNKRLFTSL